MSAHYQWRHYIDRYNPLYCLSLRDLTYLSPYFHQAVLLYLRYYCWLVRNRNTNPHCKNMSPLKLISWSSWSSGFHGARLTSYQFYIASFFSSLGLSYPSSVCFQISYAVEKHYSYLQWFRPFHPWWNAWCTRKNNPGYYMTCTCAQVFLNSCKVHSNYVYHGAWNVPSFGTYGNSRHQSWPSSSSELSRICRCQIDRLPWQRQSYWYDLLPFFFHL